MLSCDTKRKVRCPLIFLDLFAVIAFHGPLLSKNPGRIDTVLVATVLQTKTEFCVQFQNANVVVHSHRTLTAELALATLLDSLEYLEIAQVHVSVSLFCSNVEIIIILHGIYHI